MALCSYCAKPVQENQSGAYYLYGVGWFHLLCHVKWEQERHEEDKAEEKLTPVTDAVEILHKRYVGNDPKKLAALEEERRRADQEQEEYDRTGIDPYE